MKKSTRYSAALALLVALGLLAGCSQSASDANTSSSQEDALSGQQTAATAMDTAALFSDRDLEGTYDESAAVAIQFSGDSAACDSSAVTVEGSTITITAEGVYLLSGTLTDGQIVVNAGEIDKVQLVLKGADITSSTSAQPGGHGGWSKGTPPDAPDTQAAATQAPQVQTTAAQTETTQTETTQTETDTTDSTSQKGIKAEGGLVVNGGVFTMDTVDDGLHTGADLLVTAGEFTLSSGDDAVHSDAALTIQNGTFTIPYCYEGIEGLSITIEDGTFTITSHDDGLNAAGGADSSGFGGFGAGPQDAFSASSDSFIVINGGTFTVVSSGDCIDSNGDMTINGGTLDLTTNDGSEDNPGQMGGGGGRGGMGQDGQRPSREPGSLQPPTGDAGDSSTAQ